MVVPTGYPIGDGSFVALQLNFTFINLGATVGGIAIPNYHFVAIIPFFVNYSASFNTHTFDYDYEFLQYSGPPAQLWVGTMDHHGRIYHNGWLFGSVFGWAGVPYAMHYHRIANVGLARVPRVESTGWYDLAMPAFVIKDPLIVRYDPSVWVGTECLIAWATIEDATKEVYDELMTAKDYVGMEVVSLPTDFKLVAHFWPILDGSVQGLSSVYCGTTFYGKLFFWAWSGSKFHLFDDSRYSSLDPVIKPGGKVLAAGILKVGSVGVQATAERHIIPQYGDPDSYRFFPFNPAPFDIVVWYSVQAFLVGYYYERNGSHIFEVSYGAVIPPCYTVDYVGENVLLKVYLATNIPSGSSLVHQSVLARPTLIQFHPESYDNLLTVLIDWLNYLVNTDRFWLVSDVSDPLVFTPEGIRDNDVAYFTCCDVKTFRPYPLWVREVSEGVNIHGHVTSLSSQTFHAIYHRALDGPVSFLGCVWDWATMDKRIISSRFGMRWLVPWHTGVNMQWCSMQPGEAWKFQDPVRVNWRWQGGEIPRCITDFPADFTDLPSDRIIALEKFHQFFYTDVFALYGGASLIGSVIDRIGPYYALKATNAGSLFTYEPVFVGSWLDPLPQYNEVDPYDALPRIQRRIERRFRTETAHANFLSDVHIRIRTNIPREFIECVITKPAVFYDWRSGDPAGNFMDLIPTSPYSLMTITNYPSTIDFCCPRNFARYELRPGEAIPVVIGLAWIDFSTRIGINPFTPLIAQPGATYRFIRPFHAENSIISSIERFLEDIVPAFPVHGSNPAANPWRVLTAPEKIVSYQFEGQGVPFLAVGSNAARFGWLGEPAHPAPAPFVRGGAKVIGLGSLYRWAKQENLAVPVWFERYIFRHGEDGDHFISGSFKVIVAYSSYWPLQNEPEILFPTVWNYTGTNLIKPVIFSTSIFGVFNEDYRFGTILWRPPLADVKYDLGIYNVNSARLLFPYVGWRETLPAGRIVRVPDHISALAVYGTSTYLDREVVFVRQIVTLGNNSVQLMPRKAVYSFGVTVPYFTQDGGKCPLWMGEPIIGVDGVPYDDGRIVVYVYSVRGVYSFVLTPFGVENWTFEPVPKWFWKLLTGEQI